MLICEKCNKLYEEDKLPKHIEHHPYGNGTVDEVVVDYECCGQTLEEACQCDRCGEWFPIMSDDLFGNAQTVCKNCYDEMYSTEKIIKIAKKQDIQTTVLINELIAHIYESDKIERILFAKLERDLRVVPELCDYERKVILDYANDDINNTVDELFDLEKERNGE